MILIRDTTPPTIRFGTFVRRVSTPSIRIRTRSSRAERPALVRLRLEVDVGCAALGGLGDDRVHELDYRRVVGRLAQVDDLERRRPRPRPPRPPPGPRPRTGSSASISAAMSSADATAGLTSIRVISAMSSIASTFAGSDIASTIVCSSMYLTGTAPYRCAAAAVSRFSAPHVDLVGAEVEVVEPVALRDRVGELLGGDRPLVEQHPLRRDSGRAGLFDRASSRALLRESELDDHVGQESPEPPRLRGVVTPTRASGRGSWAVPSASTARRCEPGSLMRGQSRLRGCLGADDEERGHRGGSRVGIGLKAADC